jgi:hypothetical protein
VSKKQPGRSTGRSAGVTAKHVERKRPYQTARLTVYGNLRKLTLGEGGAKADGRGGPLSKV